MKGDPLPADKLKADVLKWLQELRCQSYWVYSQEEWKARGETMCDDAAVTVACDGGFCSMLNEDVCMDKEPLSDLRDLVESRGYYFEMGYHWTLHLYPLRVN